MSLVIQKLRSFLELIRFSHTLFALPFALASATLAWEMANEFYYLDLIGIVIALISARSAAMAFNRLVDRDIDSLNPRTRGRHIPSGKLSILQVLCFTILSSLMFIGSTTIFLLHEPSNPWPLYFSGPILIFILCYSFTKRFTMLAHFWLGASLMLSPLSAWIAIAGLTDLLYPTILGFAVLFWVAGFDIFYACQDFEVDRELRLHSIPSKLGIPIALHIAKICHALMLLFLFTLATICPVLGKPFLIGLIPISVLLVYEHALVSKDNLTQVNRAFFQVNAVISISLLGLIILDWFMK